MKQKVFLILAMLMAVTGAWAQTSTPLTLEATTEGTIAIQNPKIGKSWSNNNNKTNDDWQSNDSASRFSYT